MEPRACQRDGVAIQGDGSYRLSPEKGDDEGTIVSSMTGLYPYTRIDLNERVSAWGLVGIGSGELTLHRKDADPMETTLDMRMGALGLTGRVLDGTGPSGLGVNVKSDAMWVRTTSDQIQGMESAEGDVSRLRLIVQGERRFELQDGGVFMPSGELGLRIDGGDAETGTGLEVGASMQYIRGAFTIEGQVRALVAHESSGYEEWGASGTIRVIRSASGRGLTFGITPVWGNAGSQAGRLWGAKDARELEPGTEPRNDSPGMSEDHPARKTLPPPWEGFTGRVPARRKSAMTREHAEKGGREECAAENDGPAIAGRGGRSPPPQA